MEVGHFIWAGWFLIFVIPPLLLGSICTLFKFWSRGSFNKSWGLDYQAFLYKSLPEGTRPENDAGKGDFWCSYILYNLVTGAALTAFLVKLFTEVPFQTLLNSSIIVGIILTSIFLPRFIMDLCKGLKVDHETEDLEEINSLKKRLEELEAKKEE